MDKDTVIKNLVGTAFNVLQDQNHPDIDKIGEILRELPTGKDSLFDLRYRNLKGEKITQ